MSKKNQFLMGLSMVLSTFATISSERDSLKAENADLKTQLAAVRAAATAQSEDVLSSDDMDKAISQIETVVGPLSEDGTTAQPPATSADPVSVTVAAPVTAPSPTVPVSGVVDSSAVGAAVSGPGIAEGTTVTDVAATHTLVDGSSVPAITLSQPTTADHAGDGTETLTVTPAAA